MLPLLAYLYATGTLLIVVSIFVYGVLHLSFGALFRKFNKWWRGVFRRTGIRDPGYHTALVLGLIVVPVVAAFSTKQFDLAFVLAPLTVLAVGYLTWRGWNFRGRAQPPFFRFARVFYQPAVYFGGLAFSVGKTATEWGPIVLKTQELAGLW